MHRDSIPPINNLFDFKWRPLLVSHSEEQQRGDAKSENWGVTGRWVRVE